MMDAGFGGGSSSHSHTTGSALHANLDLIMDIPIDVQIVLGNSHMHVATLMNLTEGATIALDRKIGEPAEVVVNGRQMRVDGDWLGQLAERERAQRGELPYAGFVCWYADTDNIVFPAPTATLPGADNRLVPGAAHVDLAFQPRVMGESLAMLASAGSSPSERTAS